jgi:hypothetical protein
MRTNRLFLLLLTLLLKSCEVPDVQPFLKSTAEMGAAIDTGLKQVVANLRKVAIPDGPPQDAVATKRRQDMLRAQQDTLAQRARQFSAVAHSLDAYAQALSEVVTRGERRAGQLQKVSKAFDSVLKATQSFAIAIPGVALAPAAKTLLDSLARDINKAHTINQLSQLASPRQDTLVQRVARSISLGLQLFGHIDSDAYQLWYNNRTDYDSNLENLYANALKQQQAAIKPLRLISIVRNFLLTQRATLVSSRLRELRAVDSLYTSLAVRDAALTWRTVTTRSGELVPAVRPATLAAATRQLTDVLDSRERYYRSWLAIPDDLTTLYEAEQARYAVPAKDRDWLGKSQRAVAAWANAHHVLRTTLVKAKKIKATDLKRYGQASQALADAVKDVKSQ